MTPTVGGRVALRAAMLLVAIVTVTAQTTLPLKTLGPTLVEIKNNGSAAVFSTTTFYPCNVANPDPEHCSTASQEASSACNANAELKSKILDVATAIKVSWSAKVLHNANGTVTAAYTFGDAYAAAIKPIIVNGTSFTYIRSSLLLVQDQTTTQQPAFQFDTTTGQPGFVDPAGSPVTVTLTTKSTTEYVPNVALRFDYGQAPGSGTAGCSLFYSDRFDSKLSAINGLASPNLMQSYDFDILDNVQALKEGSHT